MYTCSQWLSIAVGFQFRNYSDEYKWVLRTRYLLTNPRSLLASIISTTTSTETLPAAQSATTPVSVIHSSTSSTPILLAFID